MAFFGEILRHLPGGEGKSRPRYTSWAELTTALEVSKYSKLQVDWNFSIADVNESDQAGRVVRTYTIGIVVPTILGNRTLYQEQNKIRGPKLLQPERKGRDAPEMPNHYWDKIDLEAAVTSYDRRARLQALFPGLAVNLVDFEGEYEAQDYAKLEAAMQSEGIQPWPLNEYPPQQ